MARVLGFMNAVLRGKLGGNVYSANRYGEYVRQYVKPVNPNTAGQSAARGRFAEALAMWHSLNDQNKEGWASFGANAGGLSGINAFMRLRNRAIANRDIVNLVDNTINTADGDVTVDYSLDGYIAPVIAPDPAVAPPFAALADDFTLSRDFDNDFEVGCTITAASPGTDGAIPLFSNIDPEFGFSVYMSNMVAQASHFVSNPQQIKLGVTEPMSGLTAGTEATTGLQPRFTNVPSNFWQTPSDGWVRLTAYWESSDGRSFLIGSEMVQVPPPVST
jgi:hypothetical protein